MCYHKPTDLRLKLTNLILLLNLLSGYQWYSTDVGVDCTGRPEYRTELDHMVILISYQYALLGQFTTGGLGLVLSSI